jgi:hypothetical protein
MRCAVIEYNWYHEETLPTFVRLLNDLGIEPDVYMVKRSARRHPFALTNGLRFRRRRVESIDRYGGLRFRLRRYQLLIVNSIEPIANVERLAGVRAPVLGVIHNADLLSEPGFAAFFEHPRHAPIVLGRHIARHLATTGISAAWVQHVHFGDVPAERRHGVTTFAVSGNVEFPRRDYAALLDAVEQLVAGGAALRVRIVGRSTTRDGLALRDDIGRRGLADVFELSPAEIDHPQFYRLVAGSDFMLPLIDGDADIVRPYFESKLASSIPFAIGLGVPLVIHRELSEAYGVLGCGIDYANGGLAGAMRAAIASSEDDRARWRAAVDSTRREIIDASRSNLREAIAAIR